MRVERTSKVVKEKAKDVAIDMAKKAFPNDPKVVGESVATGAARGAVIGGVTGAVGGMGVGAGPGVVGGGILGGAGGAVTGTIRYEIGVALWEKKN
ncbi:hypothetical protein [Brevibacillus parabrevis]|uniref:hypothetical protein n=1 Tax=Brevibacillus parabrevis TaxID=54914 RepID=UPI002E1BD745|nr:hypothetical protein [Brevibacillus parabrevis]